MKNTAREFGAVVIVVVVLAIFIMPAFDVEPTALRAFRAAQQLLMAFAVFAMLSTGYLNYATLILTSHPLLSAGVPAPYPWGIDLTCSRLC